MKLLIQNGHVLDPLTGLDDICDVLISEDRIEKVEKGISGQNVGGRAGAGCVRMLCDAGIYRSACTFAGSGADV